MTRTTPLFAVIISLALLGACKESLPTVRYGKILVDDMRSSDGIELNKAMLRDATLAQTRVHERLQYDPQGKDILHIRAFAGRVPPQNDGMPTILLRVELKSRDVDLRKYTFDSECRYSASSALADTRQVVEQGLKLALYGLSQQIEMTAWSTSKIIAALDNEDRGLRLFALSVLTQRKDPIAYERVARLLHDEDGELALRAVGTLMVLGDKRAVRDLTDLTYQKGPEFVRQIVYAVAAIGGREAEAYLFTVANGHADKNVRQAAVEAMQELERNNVRSKDGREKP